MQPIGRDDWTNAGDRITRRDLRDALLSVAVVVATLIAFYRIDPTFFWKDDFQLQYLPSSREIVRAWMEGSFPLLSRFSWFGGALAGEFQHGVFSPVTTLVDFATWSLPIALSARAAVMSGIQLCIAAAGVFLLARAYGLRPILAFCVAFIAALNGWNLWWGAPTWYPALASFAWLPWYWLALRRIGSGSRFAWLGGGIALALLVTAGWPFTVLMAIAITAMYAVSMFGARRWRNLVPLAAAFALGFALSAPATLMLADYFRAGHRISLGALVDWRWAVPFAALPGFVLPTIAADWPLWTEAAPHAAVELAGALVPLAGLCAALASQRREFVARYRSELVLLGVVCVLMMLPSVSVFRWPFRWLPLIHLLLAIVGLGGLQTLAPDRRLFSRSNAGMWCCALIGAALLAALAFDAQFAQTLRFGALLLIVGALWALTRWNAAAAAVAIASIVLLFAGFSPKPEVPAWQFDSAILSSAPLDPHVRYLAVMRWGQDVLSIRPLKAGHSVAGIGASLRPGDTPMLAGVEYVNGYSPIAPAGLRALFAFDTHGPIQGDDVVARIAAIETERSALLDHMNVNGLVVARGIAGPVTSLLAQRGWSVKSTLPDGVVLQRPARHADVWSARLSLAFRNDEEAVAWATQRRRPAMPVLLSTTQPGLRHYAPRVIREIRTSRLSTSALVDASPAKESSLIVFDRPWYPGFVATLNGRDLPVLRADLIMPAVELQPGDRGLLVVRYRPRRLMAGIVIAAIGALAAAVGVGYLLRSASASTSRGLEPAETL